MAMLDASVLVLDVRFWHKADLEDDRAFRLPNVPGVDWQNHPGYDWQIIPEAMDCQMFAVAIGKSILARDMGRRALVAKCSRLRLENYP